MSSRRLAAVAPGRGTRAPLVLGLALGGVVAALAVAGGLAYFLGGSPAETERPTETPGEIATNPPAPEDPGSTDRAAHRDPGGQDVPLAYGLTSNQGETAWQLTERCEGDVVVTKEGREIRKTSVASGTTIEYRLREQPSEGHDAVFEVQNDHIVHKALRDGQTLMDLDLGPENVVIDGRRNPQTTDEELRAKLMKLLAGPVARLRLPATGSPGNTENIGPDVYEPLGIVHLPTLILLLLPSFPSKDEQTPRVGEKWKATRVVPSGGGSPRRLEVQLEYELRSFREGLATLEAFGKYEGAFEDRMANGARVSNKFAYDIRVTMEFAAAAGRALGTKASTCYVMTSRTPDDPAMSMTTTIRTTLQTARIGKAAAASSPEPEPAEGGSTAPQEGAASPPRPPDPEPEENPGPEARPERPAMPGLEVVGYHQTDEVLGFVKPVDLLRGGSGARFSEPGGEHFFAIVKLRLPSSAVFAGKKKLPFSEEPEGFVYEFALSEFHLLDAGGKPLGVPLFDEAGTETGCAGEIGDGGVFNVASTDAKVLHSFEEGRLVAVKHVDGAGNELVRRFSEKGRGVARVLLKLVEEADAIEQEFVFRLARGEVPASAQFRDWAPVPLPESGGPGPDENPGAGPPPGTSFPVPTAGEWTGEKISFEVAETTDSNGETVRVIRRVIGTGWPRVQFRSGGATTSRLELGGEYPIADGRFMIRRGDSELEGKFSGRTQAEGTWRVTVKPPLQPGDPPEPNRTTSIDWKASLK